MTPAAPADLCGTGCASGFGRERMFRDVASIGAGKWRQMKEQALAASKACVAVIGRRWADGTNLPRLQDPPACGRHPAGSDPR